MSESLRNPEPEEAFGAATESAAAVEGPLDQQARECAEAEAAVNAVMSCVAEKAAIAQGHGPGGHAKRKPLKSILLASLILFNLYVWIGNPPWLRFQEPAGLPLEYYQDSWKMASYLQVQRVQEYLKEQQKLPQRVEEVRRPVQGVEYKRVSEQEYQVSAGAGKSRVVYDSNQPLTEWVGRSLIRLGLLTNGVGR